MMAFLRFFNVLGWLTFALFAFIIVVYFIAPRQTKTEIITNIERLPDSVHGNTPMR